MKRREFLQKSSLGAAFVYCTPFLNANNYPSPSNYPDKIKVIVARGNDYSTTFSSGIQELGGIQNFVHESSRIVLKPDISHNAFPEQGITTNPILIKHIAKQCYKNKAAAVYAFDRCIDPWTKCYKNSGIERAAKDSGAKMLPGNHEMYFEKRHIKEALLLKEAHVHTALQPSHILFDLPVLKRDKETAIYGGLRNLMGCVSDWDFYQTKGIDQCLAEFLYYKRPALTIIDATPVLRTSTGEKYNNIQIISTDMLAADAVACRLLGIDPCKIEHLKIASMLGFGIISETEIEIKNIVIS